MKRCCGPARYSSIAPWTSRSNISRPSASRRGGFAPPAVCSSASRRCWSLVRSWSWTSWAMRSSCSSLRRQAVSKQAQGHWAARRAAYPSSTMSLSSAASTTSSSVARVPSRPRHAVQLGTAAVSAAVAAVAQLQAPPAESASAEPATRAALRLLWSGAAAAAEPPPRRIIRLDASCRSCSAIVPTPALTGTDSASRQWQMCQLAPRLAPQVRSVGDGIQACGAR